MNYRSRDYVVQLLSAGDIYFNGLERTEWRLLIRQPARRWMAILYYYNCYNENLMNKYLF